MRCVGLEMNADLCRQRARCDVVRSAEGGEEVVERRLIGQVHSGKPEAPLVPVAVEEVVFTDGGIEETAWRDSRRVLIVVLGIRSRNVDEVGGESCSRAQAGQRLSWRGLHAITDETGLKL